MDKQSQFNPDDLLNAATAGLQTVDETTDINAVAEMLDKYDLRWKVSKVPLLLPTGEKTGFFGIVRDDTMHTFSTCREGYVPYQNSELAELLLRISKKTGYEIHSGGQFNGGGKIYLQLNTHNEIKGLGKNGTTVKGYATGINSHDGSTSLKWGAVSITICCANTYAMASRALQNSARHSASIHEKVEASILGINGVVETEKSLFDKFITLSEIGVSKIHIANIVKGVTEVDILNPSQDEYSAIAIRKSTELLQSISGEMKQKGETLWGLFSGVTHYTTHKMSAPSRENGRLESKYTGTGYAIDNKAFAEIMAYAN